MNLCLRRFALVACFFSIGSIVRADESGFEPLLNGRDLSGWVAEHGARFVMEEDRLVCLGEGDFPAWLRSEEIFENYILRFEFRLGVYGEGGVFLHAPRHGRNSTVGCEVQLSDDTRNAVPVTISSGAIFGAVAPRVQASRPLGAWNEVEVICDGPKLQVTLNGELVQDLDRDADPELRFRLRRGFLGFQDRGARHEYRNLRIKRLPSREAWEPLFTGHNFDGWAVLQPEQARWLIDRGTILAENGNGYLVTEREFQDFDLHVYVQTSKFANGGIFFRWKSLVPKDRGNEIQIEDVLDSNNPTGSVYDLARADPLPVQPEEWYLMQIRVQGNTCVVRVNGKTVAQTDRISIIRPGHIALQMHRRDSWIRFADPQIRILEPTEHSEAQPAREAL
jgi:hypothetical protein